jgi:hypothetical protein
MKAYILSDADFEMLLSAIDRDPRWGTQGGSSQVLNAEEQRVHEDAHRFFNYQIRTWMSNVKK